MTDPAVTAEQPGAGSPAPRRRGGGYLDRSRLRLGVIIGIIAAALSFLVLQGLGEATMYFYNADEAIERRASIGDKPFRLQGAVVAGSVESDDAAGVVRFSVQHEGETVDVQHRGDPPELFKEGIPVVLEGHFVGGSAVYESDRIMVRHTNEYKEENPDRVDPDDL